MHSHATAAAGAECAAAARSCRNQHSRRAGGRAAEGGAGPAAEQCSFVAGCVSNQVNGQQLVRCIHATAFRDHSCAARSARLRRLAWTCVKTLSERVCVCKVLQQSARTQLRPPGTHRPQQEGTAPRARPHLSQASHKRETRKRPAAKAQALACAPQQRSLQCVRGARACASTAAGARAAPCASLVSAAGRWQPERNLPSRAHAPTQQTLRSSNQVPPPCLAAPALPPRRR